MLSLPIYYTKEYKTKKDKTFLTGMNWYRNAHYHEQNEVKQYFHQLVKDQLPPSFKISSQYKLSIDIYYKNRNCDGANIAAMIEKFVLDALQEYGVVEQDNVTYHLGTTWTISGHDKLNPRAEITISAVSNE